MKNNNISGGYHDKKIENYLKKFGCCSAYFLPDSETREILLSFPASANNIDKSAIVSAMNGYSSEKFKTSGDFERRSAAFTHLIIEKVRD